MPWSMIDRDNRYERETIFECLPAEILDTTREQVAGVHKFSFEGWAVRFLKDVEKNSAN